ncbi:MAG: type II toxin-antitoxin system ParD family antitoxin [Cyanobacteria bacterium P01_F01_bin.150]
MQLTFPPEIEAFVQGQLDSGKYENQMDLIMAAIALLQKQEDIYQGRLLELQQDALIGWEASQRGKVVDGPTAMAQIRANLHNRHDTPEA